MIDPIRGFEARVNVPPQDGPMTQAQFEACRTRTNIPTMVSATPVLTSDPPLTPRGLIVSVWAFCEEYYKSDWIWNYFDRRIGELYLPDFIPAQVRSAIAVDLQKAGPAAIDRFRLEKNEISSSERFALAIAARRYYFKEAPVVAEPVPSIVEMEECGRPISFED
jgi:hypothetical protein